METPGLTVRELGVTERVKSAAGVIANPTVVECEPFGPVAVIVSCELVDGVVVVVKTLRVRDPVTSKPGVNAASVPGGSPLTLRLTCPIIAAGLTVTTKPAP